MVADFFEEGFDACACVDDVLEGADFALEAAAFEVGAEEACGGEGEAAEDETEEVGVGVGASGFESGGVVEEGEAGCGGVFALVGLGAECAEVALECAFGVGVNDDGEGYECDGDEDVDGGEGCVADGAVGSEDEEVGGEQGAGGAEGAGEEEALDGVDVEECEVSEGDEDGGNEVEREEPEWFEAPFEGGSDEEEDGGGEDELEGVSVDEEVGEEGPGV